VYLLVHGLFYWLWVVNMHRVIARNEAISAHANPFTNRF